MLEFVFGKPGFGGSEYMYLSIKEDIKAEKNAFILVPEQYSLFAEKDMLEKLGVKAQKNVQVLTFSRLSNMVFSSLGPLRMKYVDSAGKNMLVQKALIMCEKNLNVFKKNVTQKGFSGMLLSLFDEFKRYGIAAKEFSKEIEKCENQTLKEKLFEVNLIYEKYDEILNQKKSDAEDDLFVILKKLEKCSFLKGKLYIRFFKSFTPLEYQVVFKLMKMMDICAIFVSDDIESQKDIYRSAGNTKRILTQYASENQITIGENIFLNEDKKHTEMTEIKHLKENYLSALPKKWDKEPENIHLIQPKTIFDEIEIAAKYITRISREKGYKPEDFLVLLSNCENYQDIVPVIFEKYNIGCYLDKKITLSSHVFTRFITLSLEILSKGYSYEKVMALIRTGFFNTDKKEEDVFENYILETGVLDKNFLTDREFSYNPDNSYDLEVINSVKKKSIDKVIELEKSIRGRKTVSQICKSIYDFLEKSEVKAELERRIDEFSIDAATDKKEELILVLNGVNAVLAEAEELFGDEYITYNKFYEIFCSATENVKLGVAPQSLLRVMITETDKFIDTDAKVVMVLGASEGEFPKSFSEDGLISDIERVELEKNGIILAPTAKEKQLDEQLLIYSILSSPKEELYIFSPILNDSGETVLESEVFSEIKNIFPKIKVKNSENFEEAFLIEGRNSAFDMLWEKLIKVKGEKEKLSDFWQVVYEYFEKREDFKDRLLKVVEFAKEEEPDLKLSKTMAEKLYGKPLMLSVSKLEKYNACAFSYFLTYGLFLDERKKVSFEANDMGSVLHDVLSKYFEEQKNIDADYGKISYEDVKKDIERLIDESELIDKAVIFKTSSYHKFVLLKIKSIATLSAWKIVLFYKTSTFRPFGFEIKIGEDGIFPAYSIVLENNEAKIRGFIDRMDISEIDGTKYFNIIDYKSSVKTIDLDLAKAGVRFQPLLYAGIVADAIDNSEVSSMLYMQMNDPVTEFNKKPEKKEHEKAALSGLKVAGLVLDKEEVKENLDFFHKEKDAVHFVPMSKSSLVEKEQMDVLVKDALKTAENTAEKIANGIVEINPITLKEFDACQYCPFSSACGIND